MGENHLGECLTGGGGAEGGGETERLGDGQMALDLDERGTLTLDGLKDDTTADVQGGIDTGGGVLRAGNLDQEDGLLKSGLGSQHRGEAHTTHGRHDLTSTTMDGIGMHSDVHEIELDTTQVLFAKRTFLGAPLERGVDVLLDFEEVLDTDGLVNDNIGAISLGTEAPDLEGVILVPVELLSPQLGAFLGIGLGTVDLAGVFDLLAKVGVEGLGGEVQTVMLVGGLGETGDRGGGGDGLTVGHNGVTLDERHAGEILLKILKADFDMQLTTTGDDVLTRFFHGAHDQRIGLGELLETFDKLGEILAILAADSDTDNGRHGVLHVEEIVGSVHGGDGTGLEEVLIDTDETASVTARNVLHLLDLGTHHEHDTLDGLDVEVGLRAGLVLRALDAHLLAGGGGTGEDTTEGGEAATLVGGNHLGDVHHERTIRVALLNGLEGLIILGTGVQILGTVLLGLAGRGQVTTDHGEEGVGGVDPLLEAALHERLAGELAIFLDEGDLEGLEHLLVLLDVLVHDGHHQLGDGRHDELTETTVVAFTLVGVGPLLVLG